MKSYVKNEAVALVNAIYDSDIKLHTEDDDHIWDEIVAKCEITEFERYIISMTNHKLPMKLPLF